MASPKEQDGTTEEIRRLNIQHDVIKNAVLGGQLIHDRIPLAEIQSAIADIGSGTGIWLDDVARSCFKDMDNNRRLELIGFDISTDAFNPSVVPGVQRIKHDCKQPFENSFIGKFDLVNMRGLAFAVPKEQLLRLIKNAMQLLRETHNACH